MKLEAERLNKQKGNPYLKTFLWALILATVIFIPYVVAGKGYFLYYGDFDYQQIPFYQMIHDSIRSGNIGWSTTTDLGADIIGSYSFYMIGSPFFWITMLFPSKAVPYLMAPLLILKFGCAALSAFIYLKRYVQNKDYAVIGSLLYAFSGFGIYNIFFNHFHEAMITFPLLLAAVDELMYTGRRGMVAIAAFACCTINYYFFAGQAVFAILYWIVKMVCGSFKLTLRKFFQIAFEAILGVAASSFILLPTLATLLGNSRLSLGYNPSNMFIYDDAENYLLILKSFFLPPDVVSLPNMTVNIATSSSSAAAWLPLVGMSGVIAFYRLKGHKWLKVLMPILIAIAFVPILNSMFQLFNSTYYARWFYMMTLVMVLATVICLDNEKTDFRIGILTSLVMTVVVTLLVVFWPRYDGESLSFIKTTMNYTQLGAYVAFAVVGLLLFVGLLVFRKRGDKRFMRYTSFFLSSICVIFSVYYIGLGKLNVTYKTDFVISHALNNGEDLELDDVNDVRSDFFYDTMINLGMYWQIPTIDAFHSIVPNTITEFYNSVGSERYVRFDPRPEQYALRSFLSCKYLFDGSGRFGTKPEFSMPYWTYLNEQNGFKVYTNDCYIPYGFTYDEYITEEQYEQCSESNRHLLLLKAIVLNDEQTEKYGDILENQKNIYKYDYTEEAYKDDCENRNKLTCTDTKFDNGGFTSHITTNDSDELVFFSVPYTKGWTAYVNGEPAEIEKVNVGFMAVRVPANTECEIRFDYKTPNFTLGLGITCGCAVVFVIYMALPNAITRIRTRRSARSPRHR